MGEHHGRGTVEGVEDFRVHVVTRPGGGVGGGYEARGLHCGRLEQYEPGGEGVGCGRGPVGAHHGHGGGGEEEEVVEVVLDCDVRVEVDDAEVLGLVEREELREGGIPCEIVYHCIKNQHQSSILKRKNPFAVHGCLCEVKNMSHTSRRLLIPHPLKLPHLHRQKFHPVLIPRLYKQLAIPITSIRDLGIPLFRIHQDPLRPAAQPIQRLKYHDRVAEVVAVGGILAVSIVPPVYILVAEGGGVSGTEEASVEVGGVVIKGEEDCGEIDEASGAEEVAVELF